MPDNVKDVKKAVKDAGRSRSASPAEKAGKKRAVQKYEKREGRANERAVGARSRSRSSSTGTAVSKVSPLLGFGRPKGPPIVLSPSSKESATSLLSKISPLKVPQVQTRPQSASEKEREERKTKLAELQKKELEDCIDQQQKHIQQLETTNREITEKYGKLEGQRDALLERREYYKAESAERGAKLENAKRGIEKIHGQAAAAIAELAKLYASLLQDLP